MRPHTLILLWMLSACSSGGYRQPAGAPSTFNATGQPSNPRDAAGQPVTDLASALPDLQPQPVPDLAAPPDLGSQPDLAAPPPDMATAPDLAEQPDLGTVAADMAGCVVKLAPPVALPVRLSGEAVSWPLGDVPNPAAGVDMTLVFSRLDAGLTSYKVTISDPSCPSCPVWAYVGAGPGRTQRYSSHSTAGWVHPVLTADVPLGATVVMEKVELAAACR